MHYLRIFFVSIIMSLFQISCNNNPKDLSENHTKQISKDSSSLPFAGIFFGETPCADCPGIEMTVYLNPDSTFIETLKYLEKNTSFSDTGRWNISDKIITVSFPGKNHEIYFLVKSDSTIAMLDAEKKEIEGTLSDKYILKRKH